MRVLQLSDLHLGPEDHPDDLMRRANQRAWHHARQTAQQLKDRPDAASLVVVITGDLTDAGHSNPEEFAPVADWIATLPGRVLAVPGNHDVGNFHSSRSGPTVDAQALTRWRQAMGPDWWSHAADGHRLIGLDSMIIGSGLPAEGNQHQWLERELDDAQQADESVWVFQHAPLFLREPDEVRSDREHYWCPAARDRDRMLAVLDRRIVKGFAHGHVHRRRDHRRDGRWWRSCPALSGTHSDADYFIPQPGYVETHALPTWDLAGPRVEVGWEPSVVDPRTRFVS